jgi:hypothetical protein
MGWFHKFMKVIARPTYEVSKIAFNVGMPAAMAYVGLGGIGVLASGASLGAMAGRTAAEAGLASAAGWASLASAAGVGGTASAAAGGGTGLVDAAVAADAAASGAAATAGGLVDAAVAADAAASGLGALAGAGGLVDAAVAADLTGAAAAAGAGAGAGAAAGAGAGAGVGALAGAGAAGGSVLGQVIKEILPVIIPAAISATGDIIDNAAQREAGIESANQKLEQLKQDKEQLAQQTAIDQEATYAQAGIAEKAAAGDFTQAMSASFLGQLNAEQQFTDLQQQGAEAQGTVAARAGASGTRGNKTVSQVLQRQIAEKEGFARRSITAAREGSIDQATRGYEKTMGSVDLAREQFEPGSAYMNLYNYRRARIGGEADEVPGITSQTSYLKKIIADLDYWKGNWWAADLLSLGSAGANAYSTAYQNGYI